MWSMLEHCNTDVLEILSFWFKECIELPYITDLLDLRQTMPNLNHISICDFLSLLRQRKIEHQSFLEPTDDNDHAFSP
jgi:hypothetical protein